MGSILGQVLGLVSGQGQCLGSKIQRGKENRADRLDSFLEEGGAATDAFTHTQWVVQEPGDTSRGCLVFCPVPMSHNALLPGEPILLPTLWDH